MSLQIALNIITTHFFKLMQSLTMVTIPSSVTSIGKYAFSGCSSLTQITILSSVTSIGKGAFYNCKMLAQISIPNSLAEIQIDSFKNCDELSVCFLNPNSFSIYNILSNDLFISSKDVKSDLITTEKYSVKNIQLI